MMLKVGSEYLEGVPTIEVEKKIKLFENLDTSDGDVSFGFEIPETNTNIRLLNYPLPDSSSKSVYHRIDSDLQDESGVSLYTGFLRIERRLRRDYISLSFFSGNSNWFGMVSGSLQDMDMSAYDIEQTEANVISSWANTEGITFPLLDNGGLLTRSYPQVKIEDLVGGFYVHTVFKKIFQDSQIKLTGELFEEPLYNKLITIKNSKSQEEITAKSSNVLKNSVQVIAHAFNTVVLWQDESTYPYFDGSDNYFTLPNQYVPDVRLIVSVELNLIVHTTGNDPNVRLSMIVNNAGISNAASMTKGEADENFACSLRCRVPLEAGDILEAAVFQTNDNTDALSIISGTLKITPTFIYKTFATAALPNWTKQQYVSAIFQLFNVITSYEPKTKTLTCNLFDKLKEKEPIDISSYVTVDEVDFESFISNYGRNSTFSYQELDFDELKEYNIANFFRYGQGVIEVDNEFLSENEPIVESDFSNPFSYINPVFDMSMERTNLIELEESEQVTFDDVADDGSGNAAFHISNEVFIVGDLARIKNSTNSAYNGDWVVLGIPTGHIILYGVPFDTAASGEVSKLQHTYASSDDVFLFVNIPTYAKEKFSEAEILLEADAQPEWGLAYFSLLNTNRQINDEYTQSLSFGEIADPLFYQRTIVETYWSLVSRVLNDPVKLICTAYLPGNVYRSIDFLRPVTIKTLETTNRYYLNLMSGYQNSYTPTRLELIKLP